MEHLVRPVVVMAVGESAARAVSLAAQWLPEMSFPIRPVEVRADSESADSNATDIVLQHEVQAYVETAFERGTSLDAMHVHWICVASISDADRETVRDVLLSTVLPAAGLLYANGRPFVLSVLFTDRSSDRGESIIPFLRQIAEAAHELGIASAMQVYLLRGMMESGLALQAWELVEAAALATESLILSNLAGAEAASSIARINPQHAISVDGDPTKLQIFGRIAVFALRSLDEEISDLAAATRVREFGSVHADRAAVPKMNWSPPYLVQVSRPTLSDEQANLIGGRIRSGPKVRFSNAPSIFRDPEQEVHQLETSVERWIRDIGDWRRQVRIEFSRVLKDLRGSSVNERNQKRASLDELAAAIWMDERLDHPLPHIKEWIQQQRTSFDVDLRDQYEQVEGLRMGSAEDARRVLKQPLDQLRFEMAHRPNVWLVAVFGILAMFGCGIMIWQMFDNLHDIAEELRWLDPLLTYDVRLLQVVALVCLVTLVLVAAGSSLWEANLRWKRSFQSLSNAASRLSQQEVAALQREINLVDSHWYLKTISACRRHLSKLHVRTRVLETQLARPGIREVEVVDQTSRLIQHVPNVLGSTHAPDDSFSMKAELRRTLDDITADRVNKELRDSRSTARWVSGNVERWLLDSHQELKQLVLAERQRQHTSTNTDVRESIDEIALTWPRLSSLFLVPDHRHKQLGVADVGVMFASGILGEIAHRGPHALALGNSVELSGDGEELLLCRAQTGLTAETVV